MLFPSCRHSVTYKSSVKATQNTSQPATTKNLTRAVYIPKSQYFPILQTPIILQSANRRNWTESFVIHVLVPNSNHPPWKMLEKWKISITKAFINNLRSSSTTKYLNIPKIPTPPLPLHQMPWEHKNTNLTIIQYIESLPPFYWTIIGDINISPDDGAHLAKFLKSGWTIWSYSDGSVKNGVAAHSCHAEKINENMKTK